MMFVGCFACTAALAIHGQALTLFGQQVGAYVDNEEPNQCQDVALARSSGSERPSSAAMRRITLVNA